MPRPPVGKPTKAALMMRVVRNVQKHRLDPAWQQAQLAPHERPARPARAPPALPTKLSARTEATAAYASSSSSSSSSSPSDPSSALTASSDPRPALSAVFHLPLPSPSHPHAAQAWSKDLALQMVTHPSSPDVHVGTAPHNARLAFYGRRLLAMHFQLFVLDAAARVGPTAVSANGGFHAVPVDTRLAGPKSQRKSAPGDGTPDGLAAAVLDDAVLGRMVGYDWKIKELANWTHKMGYDARGSLVTSIYGGLAHAYGLPATQRIFLADTLPALKPLLPAWLRPEADRQAERVLEQGGVWGPSGAVGVEGAGEAGEGVERVEV